MRPSDPDNSGETASEDLDDFAAAMQDVVPMAKTKAGQTSRVTEDSRDTAPTTAQLQRREAAVGSDRKLEDENFLTLSDVPQVDPLQFLEWRKDGVQLAVFDKLRRGGYELQSTLDLHRKTVSEARTELFVFLRQAQQKGHRGVLISPGKGQYSKTPARLKSYVAAWLTEHPEVIAFCSAQRHHGGTGSVYALVRKSSQASEDNRELHGSKSDPLS